MGKLPKELTKEEEFELKNWLDFYGIPMSKLHREFSDGFNLASLLKKIYPKIVDINNYPKRSNYQLKLENWEILNRKVLCKVDLQQKKSVLESLAKGTPGVIELLLWGIMQQEKTCLMEAKRKQLEVEQEHMWCDTDQTMIVNVNKKIGDAIVQVPQKMILFSIFEESVQESDLKASFLTKANQKLELIQTMFREKEQRILELSQQLEMLTVTSQ